MGYSCGVAAVNALLSNKRVGRPYAMNGEVATLESSFPDEKSDISDE